MMAFVDSSERRKRHNNIQQIGLQKPSPLPLGRIAQFHAQCSDLLEGAVVATDRIENVFRGICLISNSSVCALGQRHTQDDPRKCRFVGSRQATKGELVHHKSLITKREREREKDKKRKKERRKKETERERMRERERKKEKNKKCISQLTARKPFDIDPSSDANSP